MVSDCGNGRDQSGRLRNIGFAKLTLHQPWLLTSGGAAHEAVVSQTKNRLMTSPQPSPPGRQKTVAERRGWQVVTEYRDAGISGAKGRDSRPGLDQMLKDASKRRFDVVMAWAIDRLGVH
jgi:hypothetical protein